ncbi:Cystathionine beta-lyase PatB [Caulifigura coniformis]|uniref:cysteine-S-conjugate beta-lyase n=1 Tax=Caulifigura coniformis TaxID=2527983 RepID=A0A517SBC5_9PLAN|nr:PatB family C-S lyase [Caulifigura coniformis]QDT53425.1 Cystathionine beta-lyase PatB [Caulifigura coniformis]
MPTDFDFDVDPRTLRHPDNFKWTRYPADVLPLWIADMDYPIAPGIERALKDRVTRSIGYHHYQGDPRLTEQLRRKVEADGITGLPEQGWVSYIAGVVPGLYAAVVSLTDPGDDVITMTPIYPPFLSAITDHGRNLRAAKLACTPTGWEIDWDALEAAVTPKTKLLLFCHPHNPTGRVWTEAELRRLAEFVERHNLFIASDELHADLTLDGTHIPFVQLASEALKQRCVTLIGPCKAYNTAGLGIGAMVSHSPQLLLRIRRGIAGISAWATALSVTMWQAALEDDGQWLKAVIDYLRENRNLVETFVNERLPGVVHVAPQATYLAWFDYRSHRRAADIQQYLLEEGKVALNDGAMFGAGFQGFVRLNFATGRTILTEALERLARVH